ncbi:diacylglycerol/lipid kinase family protein [Runella slithyformis]|uniref:Diacylglycerol kinase catalytic region n=1 Tax=Runella slithyformis (strain ATCC 29530 / DSM 19594 / LMG 11500 / NCIMB 11436 / LSU 4) TaxID=761193 RepID=A0A7U4E8I0_RUNSL|nr:diacylglycerol kinase family protein [Runella slithyformis]AEI51269.1 diacylglycerol kinase catalytic region [Runella slithyformis DSM 19594]
MNHSKGLKLFFLINPGSGTNKTDWPAEITAYFADSAHTVELFQLNKDYSLDKIKEKIGAFSPHRVVAVGGDGTLKLAAECIRGTTIPLGMLPAGSANGLATELGIPPQPAKALEVLVNGREKKIHATLINGQLCIHLSDIGLNAYVVKKFEMQKVRGMWGYVMASLKVLWQNPQMEVEMVIDKKAFKISAAMIVVANATKYGTGAVINPVGALDDDVFEVVVIKKIAVGKLLKMAFFQAPYDPETVEIFQTDALKIRSGKKVYFQIDGEYLGKVKEVKAILLPEALTLIVPVPEGGK